MDLKALVAAKRKAAAEEFQGRKYVKRSDLEAGRLQKLRDEEEQERQQGKAQAQRQPVQLDRRRKTGSGEIAADEELSREEVVRRLRALEQPVTLFGEDDAARLARLKSASAALATEDDVHNASAENETLRMARAEKAEKASRARAAAAEAAAAEAERKTNKLAGSPGKEQGDGTPTESAGIGDGNADLMAAFRAAAAAVAERQAEAAMATEDVIMKYLSRWCDAWRDDLERRPAEIKESGPGQQALLLYKSTMEYFKPMMRSLRKRDIPADLLAGIWMIVRDIKDRNYLHANTIYMSLAVGNQAWPIGVTSIGIHERSSREKISHVMNTGGAAHIMNDEATRKYLQAMKRLLTVLQRLYPTDPSRAMDFDGYKSAERGAAGGGSDKLALLEAEARGDTWRDHGLSAAPHFLHEDGTVKVPQAWADTLKQVYKDKTDIIKPTGTSSPARRPGTPGVSPAQKPPLSRQAKVA